jgi:hypothetical protein
MQHLRGTTLSVFPFLTIETSCFYRKQEMAFHMETA